MTWGPRHDWSVDLGIYRLCARCAQPDLVAVRRMPCRPREDAAEVITRKAARAAQFQGSPSVTSKPLLGKPHTKKLGRS
jgi:hypothetical protein